MLVFLFLGLVIASYSDIRTREVPDTVSYGLIILGLLGGLILALIQKDVTIFVMHLSGFVLGAVLGFLMYYGRQWGGGDAKLIMGVGAILGFSLQNMQFVSFLILMVLAGAAYGMLYTLGLGISQRQIFIPAFKKMLRKPSVHRVRIGLIATAILLMILLFLAEGQTRLILAFLILALYVLVYSWIFIQTIEQSIMIKDYRLDQLTEGDWIAEDVTVKKNVLVSRKTTGITKEQIALLKKSNVKKVKVREGIPFVPSFLLGYIALLALQYWVGTEYLLLILP